MIPGSLATAAVRHLLTELSGNGRTGALHVDGRPGGTVYLVAGRIVYAESPAGPGVRERLIGAGRLDEADWLAAQEEGAARHEVGSALVRQGVVEYGELVCHVLAAVCDAGHAVLQTPDADLRFVPDERHWLGLIAQVELTALTRETARRLSAAAPRPAPVQPRPVQPAVSRPAAPRPAAPAVPEPAPLHPRPAPNALPSRRTAGRAGAQTADGERQSDNGGPHGDNGGPAMPDYATLKRIRQALLSSG